MSKFQIGEQVYHIWGWGDDAELKGPYTITEIVNRCPCCDAVDGEYLIFDVMWRDGNPRHWASEFCHRTQEETILEYFEEVQKGKTRVLEWEALPQEEKDQILKEREERRKANAERINQLRAERRARKSTQRL